MPKQMIFLSELSAPASGQDLYRAQVLKTGRFKYGEEWFDITQADIKAFCDNFAAGVKGPDVPLNYRHKEGALDMCGHVKRLVASQDGNAAYAFFEITEPVYKERVDNGTLKYTSSEIDFEYEPGDGRKLPAFTGLAITPNPFLKDMEPISKAAVNFEECRKLADEAAKCPNCGAPLSQAEMDAKYCDSCDTAFQLNDVEGKRAFRLDDASGETTPTGEPMPETAEAKALRLEEENKRLTAQLEDAKKPGAKDATALQLEEARRQLKKLEDEQRDTTKRMRLESATKRVKRLVRRGQLTANGGIRLLHDINLILGKGKSTVIELSEPARRYKLAEYDSATVTADKDKDNVEMDDEAVDKVDVIDALLDTLENVPANVSLDDNDDDEGEEAKKSEKGALDTPAWETKVDDEAQKLMSEDKDLDYIDAVMKAKKNLEDRGIRLRLED